MNANRSGAKIRLEICLPYIPFFVAVLLRLLALGCFETSRYFLPLGGDRGLYQDVATAYFRGEGVKGAFTFLPLYPWMLGKIYAITGGPNLGSVGIIQALLEGCTALLLSRLTEKRYGRIAGLIAGLAFAFLGSAIIYSLVSMPVSLGLFWTVLTAYCSNRWSDSWNWRRASAMGLMLGIGGQILGSFWLAIFPFAIWIAASSAGCSHARRLMRGAAVLIVAGSCSLPTLIHNYNATQQWLPVTAHGGLNLYLGNNPRATGYASDLPGARRSAEELTLDSIAVASGIAGSELDPALADRFWRDAALRFMYQHPFDAVSLFMKKTRRLVSIRDFDDTGLHRLLPEACPLLKLGFVSFGLIWLLACLGLPWRSPRVRNIGSSILAASFALGILLTFVTARYRLPIAVLLIPAAAGTLTSLPSAFLQKNRKNIAESGVRRKKAFAMKLMLGAAGIAVSLLPHRLPDTRLPDDLNRAAFCLNSGELANALFFADRASARFPSSDEAWFSYGNALFCLGRQQAAIEAYSKSLSIAPNRTDAMFNSAIALEELGRIEEAIAMCRRLLVADKNNSKAWFALARLLRETKDEDGSKQAIKSAAEIVGWDNPQIQNFSRGATGAD